MSEALWGVLIGGIVGALPSVTLVFVEVWKQKRQQAHEVSLRKIDLIDAQRMKAITAFTDQLGAMFAGSIGSGHSHDNFFAAMEQAAAYVSEETLLAMQEAVPVILAGWRGERNDLTREQKFASPELSRLHDCLRREMHLSYEVAKKVHDNGKHLPE